MNFSTIFRYKYPLVFFAFFFFLLAVLFAVLQQSPSPVESYTKTELIRKFTDVVDEELEKREKDSPDLPIKVETKKRLRDIAKGTALEIAGSGRFEDVPETEANLRESIRAGCPELSMCSGIREDSRISRSVSDMTAGYKNANDLTTQLISLATGILALSITFLRDVLKENSPTWALKAAWASLLFSIIFGIWMMMAITGNIFLITSNSYIKPVVDKSSIVLPSGMQIISFLLGILFLIYFGARTLRGNKKAPPPPPRRQRPRSLRRS